MASSFQPFSSSQPARSRNWSWMTWTGDAAPKTGVASLGSTKAPVTAGPVPVAAVRRL